MIPALLGLPLFSYTSAEQQRAESEQRQCNYRHSDPITSKEAGIAARSFAKSDQAHILKALSFCSMAAEEVSNFFGWNDHVRVNRRLVELVRAGLIERTDERHINQSGRSAFRYRLTQKAMEAI